MDEVGHRIEVGAAIERRRDRQAGDHRHQQRVAVGWRLGDQRGAHHGALAGLVVDDDVLPQSLAEMLGDHAGDHVGRAAWCIGHDELDRLGGPGLGVDGQGGDDRKGGDDATAGQHAPSILGS